MVPQAGRDQRRQKRPAGRMEEGEGQRCKGQRPGCYLAHAMERASSSVLVRPQSVPRTYAVVDRDVSLAACVLALLAE